MKRFLLLLILAGLASAQTVTVQVVIKQGLIQKIWNIILRPKTILADFSCTATEMEPGDTATCTVTLNQAARPGSAVIAITLPAGFTGPASVTIPAGSATTTFQITRLDLVAGTNPLFHVVYSIWLEGCAATHYAETLIACCARVDRCGLRDDQIAWEPCVG